MIATAMALVASAMPVPAAMVLGRLAPDTPIRKRRTTPIRYVERVGRVLPPRAGPDRVQDPLLGTSDDELATLQHLPGPGRKPPCFGC